jgi:serine/threonine-protein kinase
MERLGLLRNSQLTKLRREILPQISDDPQELLFALKQRGWITSYQAEEILQGRIEQLILGGYQILAPIGSGGMGQVFKALQPRLHRIVALKVIKPEIIRGNPRAYQRFKREAKAAARLNHPNIVAIYDADEANGVPFLVLEYVDGPDLEKLVRQQGPLPWEVACDYAKQAALGLQHAFEAGFVHRDIKPSNLLICNWKIPSRPCYECQKRTLQADPFGRVKILDLGLVRTVEVAEAPPSLTRDGAVMGTPDFMAPEQALNSRLVDIRADLYSLGGTLYFLLTGHVPFPGGTLTEKLLKQQQYQPEPIQTYRPDVPEKVIAVVARLMAKEPADRFQTPLELAEALEQLQRSCATQQPQSALSTTEMETPSDHSQLKPGLTDQPQASDEAPSAQAPLSSDTVRIVTAYSLTVRRRPVSDHEFQLDRNVARKAVIVKGHQAPVSVIRFSPDGTFFVTGGLDQCLQVWSFSENPENLATWHDASLGEIQSLAISPNGAWIAIGSASRDSSLHKWAWREPSRPEPVSLGSTALCEGLTFSPDGKWLAAASGGAIAIWDIAAAVPKKRLSLDGFAAEVKALAFSPDSRVLVCGDARGQVQVWRWGWMGCRRVAALEGHEGATTAVTFSKDGRWFATAGVDLSVRIWPVQARTRETPAMVLRGFQGVVRQIHFLPDSDMLLTVGDTSRVKLWNWATGEREHLWHIEQAIISSIAISPDGSWVAAGSSDGTVTVYDLVSDEQHNASRRDMRSSPPA